MFMTANFISPKIPTLHESANSWKFFLSASITFWWTDSKRLGPGFERISRQAHDKLSLLEIPLETDRCFVSARRVGAGNPKIVTDSGATRDQGLRIRQLEPLCNHRYTKLERKKGRYSVAEVEEEIIHEI